jgi:hypothetical protein
MSEELPYMMSAYLFKHVDLAKQFTCPFSGTAMDSESPAIGAK